MSSLDSGEEGGERPSRPDWWDEQEEEEEGEERKRVSGLRVIKYVFPTSPNTNSIRHKCKSNLGRLSLHRSFLA